MHRDWEAPSCYGNGLGLSKMAALSAWMPSRLAGGVGGGRRDIKGWRVHFTSPPPEKGSRTWAKGRGAGLSHNHFKDTPGAQPPPSKCWQLNLWSSKASTGNVWG